MARFVSRDSTATTRPAVPHGDRLAADRHLQVPARVLVAADPALDDGAAQLRVLDRRRPAADDVLRVRRRGRRRAGLRDAQERAVRSAGRGYGAVRCGPVVQRHPEQEVGERHVGQQLPLGHHPLQVVDGLAAPVRVCSASSSLNVDTGIPPGQCHPITCENRLAAGRREATMSKRARKRRDRGKKRRQPRQEAQHLSSRSEQPTKGRRLPGRGGAPSRSVVGDGDAQPRRSMRVARTRRSSSPPGPTRRAPRPAPARRSGSAAAAGP